MNVIGDLERVFAAAIYPNRALIAIVAVLVVVGLVVLAIRRRWDRPVRRHPRAAGVAVVAALVVAVPATWYLGSPLFLTTTIDEPPPVAAAQPSVAATPEPVRPTASPALATVSPTPSPSPTPEPLLERSGQFAGADDFHFGEGTARLIEVEPGSFTVRLEDFAVRNGPDLYVYLSPAADGYVEGSIELGRLKADRGNQNYDVPVGIEVSGAGSVVIWCRQFSVLFATAPLS